jgi:carbon starvation protein
MGYLIYRVKLPLALVTVIGLALMAVAMFIGVSYPMGGGVGQTTWVALLLFYSFIASVVPVWILLQPRDYLNSFWLYAGLGLLAVSILFVHPTIHADAVRLSPPGAEKFPLFPFLFITIACGAVSGLHSLISSGTTSRQLNRETDAPAIGYGGMLLEGGLATVAVLACTSGVASREVWLQNYADYGSVNALGGFVSGGAALMNGLGIPMEFARMFIAVTVIGFALTTLDSSARIARFMVAELGAVAKIPLSQNRYFGSAFCCILGFCLASYKVAGKATAQIIWPVFGVSNQVLACLALLIVSLFLYRARKPIYFTFIPMIFMLTATMWALILNLRNWVAAGQWPLAAIGVAVLACEIWIMVEGLIALRRMTVGVASKPQTETSADAIQ